MLNAEIPNPSLMGGENLVFKISPSVGFIYPLGVFSRIKPFSNG